MEIVNKEMNVTVIVVTHDHTVGSAARRQILLVDGQIASDEVS